MKRDPNTFWSPYAGGIALGLVLLATYLGLGVAVAVGIAFALHLPHPLVAVLIAAFAIAAFAAASRIERRLRGEEPDRRTAEPSAPISLA